jgi:predicted TPR repeat methyltransferase
MPDRALIKKMVEFLRDAKTEWARLAEIAEVAGKHDEALRARNQEAHCELEVARLLAALPESERP